MAHEVVKHLAILRADICFVINSMVGLIVELVRFEVAVRELNQVLVT